MKLLLLHPDTEQRQKLTQGLKDRGAVVLSAASHTEAKAFLKTHGTTLEIAVIHREGPAGVGNPGEALFKELKADAKQSDLPVIFTSDVWKDAEFAAHQSKDGANAYLKSPYTSAQLIECVTSVIGSEWGGTHAIESKPENKGAAGKVFKLEEVGSGYQGQSSKKLSIQFEMPDSEAPSESFQEAVIPEVRPETRPETKSEAPLEILQTQDSPEIKMEFASEVETSPRAVPSTEIPAQEASVTRFESSPAPTGSSDSGGISLSSGPEMELESVIDFGQDKRVQEESASEGEALEAAIESAPARGQPIELSVDGELPPELPSDSLVSPPDEQPVFNLADALQPASQNPIFELPVADNTQLAPTSEAPIFESSPAPEFQRPSAPEAENGDSEDAAQEMPYLYNHQKRPAEARAAHPVGDSVVPGGASQSPDIETLKRYLLLREQDVAALSMQLKRAREQVQALESDLQSERSERTDMQLKLEEQARKIKDFDRELAVALESSQTEIDNAKFETKVKADKLKAFDGKIREAAEETERLKERVRIDIRKIRVREKELENRLEILRKDSEALIGARENKIVELKRKVDLLEFNMDLLQDQHQKEKERAADLREKLAKAAQVVRVAGGLLGEDKTAEALASSTTSSRNPSSQEAS